MTTRPDLASPRPFVRCDRCNRLRPADAACCEPVFKKVDVEIPESEAVKRARAERSVRQASRIRTSGYAATLAGGKPEPISDNGTDNHADIVATAPDMTADRKTTDKEPDIVVDNPAPAIPVPAITVREITVHESAVALGRLGGVKGGPARARMLTVAQRHEIAQKAARARWKAIEPSVQVQLDDGMDEANLEKQWGETKDCPNDIVPCHWGRLRTGQWVGYCQQCGRWVGRAGDSERLHSHIVWQAWTDSLSEQARRTAPDELAADRYFERMICDAIPEEPFWSRPVVGEITR